MFYFEKRQKMIVLTFNSSQPGVKYWSNCLKHHLTKTNTLTLRFSP